MIQPVNGPQFWSHTGKRPTQPPLARRMPRRLAKNRRREERELSNGNKMSKSGIKTTYNNYYEYNYNKRKCLYKDNPNFKPYKPTTKIKK